jgi:hypothetical protein
VWEGRTSSLPGCVMLPLSSSPTVRADRRVSLTPRARLLSRWAIVSLTLLLGAACRGDGGPTSTGGEPQPPGTTPPTNPPVTPPTTAPTIAVTLARDTVTVFTGARDSVALTLIRGGGYAGEVTFVRSIGPDSAPIIGGIDIEFAPTRHVGTNTPSITWLRLTVDTTLVPGVYRTYVEARGTSVATAALRLVVRVDPPPAAGTLTVTPDRLTVVQGQQNVPATIRFTRAAGVTGAASFSVDRLPSTVTASVTPNPLVGDSAQLRVNVSPNHPAGGIRFVVRARIGVREVVDSVDLITSLLVPLDAGVVLDAAALSITAGGVASLGARVRRTGGYTSPVTLSLEGAPSGLAAVVTPTPVTDSIATVQFTASAALAAGSYPVQIVLTGAGLDGPRRASLTVVISAPASNRIQWTFCDPLRRPRWFATRTGTAGPWTRITPIGDVFDFDFPDNGQVAMVRDSAGGTVLEVFTLRPSEMFTVASAECRDHPARITVQGTVSGVDFAQGMSVAVGGSDTLASRGPTTFSLTRVAARVTDLLAVRGAYDPATPLTNVLRLILRRDVQPVAGTPLPVLDFESSEWRASGGTAVRLFETNGEAVGTEMALFTTNGFAGTYLREHPATGTVRSAWGPLPSALRASDLLRFTAFTTHATRPRRLAVHERGLDFFEHAFGPVLGAPSVTVAGTTPVLVRTTIAWPTAYAHDASITLQQGNGLGARTVTLHTTRAFVGATAPTLDVTVPNFVGTSGWDPQWSLQPSTPISWSVWLRGLEGSASSAPTSGLTIRQAGALGTLVP